MRRVILESPYAAPDSAGIQRNLDYARACLRDCIERGEAPIASHLLYTQPGVLRDEEPRERLWGIEAGLVWGEVAEAAVFYVDLGWSQGMLQARERHRDLGTLIEERGLPGFGTCRHCGCTETQACEVPLDNGGRHCGWLDGTHRVCDAPACVAKELTF